jgi:hypothetical protein
MFAFTIFEVGSVRSIPAPAKASCVGLPGGVRDPANFTPVTDSTKESARAQSFLIIYVEKNRKKSR